jgi:putative hydrolase of the HAD superfamily
MRAFFFDLDDTLFDHQHSTRAALAAVQRSLPGLAMLSIDSLREMHSALLEELHVRVLRGEMSVDDARIERLRRLVESQGHIASDEALRHAARAYRAEYLAARRPVHGALQVLEALHPHGAIAIISNNLADEQTGKIEVCGFTQYLGELIELLVSQTSGATNPAPAIFHVARPRGGAGADEAVMIGDSWTADIEGARAAGIRAIWFNPEGQACPQPGCVTELSGWQPLEQALRRILE